MKIQSLFSISLLCLGLQAYRPSAGKLSVKPVVAYATIDDQRRGDIKGSSVTPGFVGQIALVNVEYNEVSVDKYQLVIEKYVDASSQELQNAYTGDDNMSKILVHMIKEEKGSTQVMESYNFENGHITNIQTDNSIETITFECQKENTVGN